MRAQPGVVLALLLAAHATAGTASTPRAAAVLVPDPARKMSASRGGEGTAFRIDSSILGETRRIDVVLPPSFDRSAADRRYPVIVVLDGETLLAPVSAAGDQLARHGLIPESILIAIENEDPYRGRVHDLTPPGLSVSGSGLDEGGDRFLDFIEQELLPAVDARLRGGPPRSLLGHSSGGILAIYAAATRPGFQAVVALDAPVQLSGSWLSKKLRARATSDRTPLRFAFFGTRFAWPEEEWNLLAASAPPSWRLYHEMLRQEGHETVGMIGAYLGLRELFADYSRLAAPVSPTTRILTHYDETLQASFGVRLIPPQRILHDVAQDLATEGRGAQARQAYEALVSGYGKPEDDAALLQEIVQAERQPPPTETVEDLLATPFPTPEEAKAYLGEWKGDIWMEPGQPRDGRTVLRLRVEDGRVVAEIERLDAPEEQRVQVLGYLKVTARGLSFGRMNGMRPRGLVIHEGTLQGDTLSGQTRWGGIRVTYPAGMNPPRPGFSFTRVRP